MTKKKTPLVGSFISIAGGVNKSVERAVAIGCTTMQIFTKSNRSWASRTLGEEEIAAFKKGVKDTGLSEITIHASYLINIGSKDAAQEKKSTHALIDEVRRAELLAIPYLVLHPGSHTGAGEEACIKKIAKNLDETLQEVPGHAKILLETMAGQGTNIGVNFEQLAAIIDLSKEKRRLGVCLDTCHVFSAGYNIGTHDGYEETIEKFDKIIGINRLKAIHVNDSKTELGSNKDRHANLGDGKIPHLAFSMIMNDKRLTDVAKVLETPDETKYAQEIEMLKKMMK